MRTGEIDENKMSEMDLKKVWELVLSTVKMMQVEMDKNELRRTSMRSKRE